MKSGEKKIQGQGRVVVINHDIRIRTGVGTVSPNSIVGVNGRLFPQLSTLCISSYNIAVYVWYSFQEHTEKVPRHRGTFYSNVRRTIN